jgi:hypothetical protein
LTSVKLEDSTRISVNVRGSVDDRDPREDTSKVPQASIFACEDATTKPSYNHIYI